MRTWSSSAVSVAPSALLRAVRSASTSVSSAGRRNMVSWQALWRTKRKLSEPHLPFSNDCPYRKPKTADRDRELADTRSR